MACEYCNRDDDDLDLVDRDIDGYNSPICGDCWQRERYKLVPTLSASDYECIDWIYALLVLGMGVNTPWKAMIVECVTDIPKLFQCQEFLDRVTLYKWARIHRNALGGGSVITNEILLKSAPELAEWIMNLPTNKINDVNDKYVSAAIGDFDALWTDVWKEHQHWNWVDCEPEYQWNRVNEWTPELTASYTSDGKLSTMAEHTIEWENAVVRFFQNHQYALIVLVPTIFQFLGPQFVWGQHTGRIQLKKEDDPADVHPMNKVKQILKRFARGWQDADRIQKRQRVAPLQILD